MTIFKSGPESQQTSVHATRCMQSRVLCGTESEANISLFNLNIAMKDEPSLLPTQCPTSTRPFSPQLLATFSKVLGDGAKEIRLAGGLGLANVLAISPKLDSILVDICTILAVTFGVTIPSPPANRPLGLHQQILTAAAIHASVFFRHLISDYYRVIGNKIPNF